MKVNGRMEYIFNHPWGLGLLLAVVLAVVLDLGRRVAVRLELDQSPTRKDQTVAIRDGLFILLSLLLGFTLSLAASRFTERRSLLVKEVNSIGTTYLRASTLPAPYRDNSKRLLREYVDARLELDHAGLDAARFNEASSRSKRLQEELWLDAATVAQNDRTAITAVYLNSLNETIDLHEDRVAALENRVPLAIWFLIISVSVIAAFTRGLTLNSRFWLMLILAPVIIAIAVALIADLDTPSAGLIRQDQRVMQRLKADINFEPTNPPTTQPVKADK